MEAKRKQQLYKQIDNAYKAWYKKLDPHSKVDDIEETLEMISQHLAFGTIIVSGRNNPSAYIGTHKHCAEIKRIYGGQIGAISNSWYWLGITYTDNIQKIAKNPRKNLIINVPADDIEDSVLTIGEISSLDIKYGCEHNGRASYIGSYKVCILLKRKFGGKIGKLYNHWHWIGFADFQQITLIHDDYHKKTRRFHRKKIIFMQ